MSATCIKQAWLHVAEYKDPESLKKVFLGMKREKRVVVFRNFFKNDTLYKQRRIQRGFGNEKQQMLE